MHGFCIPLAMKQIFALLFLFLFGFGSKALAQVQVIVDPDITAMEEARIAKNRNLGMKVYRIMVAFYPNRTSANEKLAEVRNSLGGKYSSMVLYDEPNFKVYVGEFSVKSDADAALSEIRKKYPGAMVVSDYVQVKSH